MLYLGKSIMDNQLEENAIAAIRVSSIKQGTDGDSPEAQKEQIERFAQSRHLNIKKFFVFMESASKEQQPMQEAIDYCKKPKNGIKLFIIKSIDRFTRGGSYSYEDLKNQLDRYGVKLVDIYGIIGSQQVNTLEHLGIEFPWSVYSPTKKSEILEAERSKDELRDIMSRMIGAEIRYARMGYWVRKSPLGFINEKIETGNGKRCILKPHPVESEWIIKMFELRCRGTLGDHEIVAEVNKMGFKSRVEIIRDQQDKTKILKEKGGKPLNIKGFWAYIQNTTYAGVSSEKWTQQAPLKAKYDGLVSIEVFNKANRGKVIISEVDGEIKIYKRQPPDYLVNKGVRNPDFPYKRFVMCPHCERPLFGSASRGKMGKYYPAYHCNKRGHYFRVSQEDFDKTLIKFVRNIKLSEKYIDDLVSAVNGEWEKRQKEDSKDKVNISQRISELGLQAKMAADKIKMLTSESAIRYMEADIIKADQEVADLLAQKNIENESETVDMGTVMKYIKYFLEHLHELVLLNPNPVEKASYFGVLFDKAPTYEELKSGTPKLAECIKLNDVFLTNKSYLAGGLGFDPMHYFRRILQRTLRIITIGLKLRD